MTTAPRLTLLAVLALLPASRASAQSLTSDPRSQDPPSQSSSSPSPPSSHPPYLFPPAWTSSRSLDPAPPSTSPPPALAPLPSPPPRTHLVFYGWQNMLVGELGVGLTAIGLAAGSAKVAVPGLLIYAAGPPTVHALNGSNAKAWGSVVFHVGLPLLGAGIGALTAATLRRNAPGWAILGTEIGVVSAPIADGLFLGWARAPDTPTPPKSRATPLFAFSPAPGGGLGDVVVGAGGTF